MEIVSLSINPVVVAVKPWKRTAPKVLTINRQIHCRICTILSGRAMEHVEHSLHSDTSVKGLVTA